MDKQRIIKIKEFLDTHYGKGYQTFYNQNSTGDYGEIVFECEGVKVLHFPTYEYLEVLGLTIEEIDELIYHGYCEDIYK